MDVSRPNVDLRIEQLVLHDIPAHQRHQIAAEVERELARLLGEDAAVLGQAGGKPVELPAHAVQVAAGARPDAIAAQVARSIYAALGGGAGRGEP